MQAGDGGTTATSQSASDTDPPATHSPSGDTSLAAVNGHRAAPPQRQYQSVTPLSLRLTTLDRAADHSVSHRDVRSAVV